MRNKKRHWHPPTRGLDASRSFRRRRIAWTLLLVVPVWTQAQAVSPAELGAGGLLWKGGNGYTLATTLSTDVEINVNGLVARVAVRQAFENTGSDWVEGVYVFPLPDRAAVDHMRVRVGERLIEGEVREKAAARKSYETAKRQGRKTSLVEQQRANLFTTSLANIAPGERVVVEIEYLETIVFDSGEFGMRFPMTLTPRYMPGDPVGERRGSGWSADTTEVPDASLISPPVVGHSSHHRVRIDAHVDAGMPLDLITSRYHPVSVTETSGRYTLSLTDPDVRLDHDFELAWRPVQHASPVAMTFTEAVGEKGYHLVMVMPPDTTDLAPLRMPRETIFVIDTSGSMHGTSIVQAKQALLAALEGLMPGDRFNLIEFNSSMQPLFADPVDASPQNVELARRFVSRLVANGGTEMLPALEYALRQPVSELHLRQVIFITDGSVGNEAALYTAIEKQLGAARLFTIGIGSAPNSWFMRRSAELGRGAFTTISATHEVAEKLRRLFAKIEAPQVTDIAIEWPDSMDVEMYPSRIPDLYYGEPVSVRVRTDRVTAAGERIRIRGETPSGTWTEELPLTGGHNAFGVAALWARARIEDRMDAIRRGADADAVRRDIVDTALEHHLVSHYTSLVAVDKTPVRPAGAPLSSEPVPNLLPHGQALTASFPATATLSGQLVLRGLLILMLAFALLAWQRRHAALA